MAATELSLGNPNLYCGIGTSDVETERSFLNPNVNLSILIKCAEQSFFEAASCWSSKEINRNLLIPNVYCGFRTFVMEPERSLWNPNVHFRTRTLILEPEDSCLNPNVKCGTRTFTVEPERSLWNPNVHFGTRTLILAPEGSYWNPNVKCGTRTFTVEPERSLWNPNVHFGTRTLILAPEGSYWNPNVKCGTRTFTVEPERPLWKPNVHYGTRTVTCTTMFAWYSHLCSVLRQVIQDTSSRPVSLRPILIASTLRLAFTSVPFPPGFPPKSVMAILSAAYLPLPHRYFPNSCGHPSDTWRGHFLNNCVKRFGVSCCSLMNTESSNLCNTGQANIDVIIYGWYCLVTPSMLVAYMFTGFPVWYPYQKILTNLIQTSSHVKNCT